MKDWLIQGVGIFLWGVLFMAGMRTMETVWVSPEVAIVCVVYSEDDSHCRSYDADVVIRDSVDGG